MCSLTLVLLRGWFRTVVAALLVALAIGFPFSAAAEQASQPGSVAAAQLDAGRNHTCAILADGNVRCWGYGAEGELGYADTETIGDDETPASAGPVDLGPGRTATAISVGDFHTCALLDDGNVRCWGFAANGRLGYGNESNIGDDEAPGSVGPVDLGPGRTAVAISAGGVHTCALLDDASLRCWGFGVDGRLGYATSGNIGDDGYGASSNIGDDETPATAGPVDIGAGRTAVAISAGSFNTCALLDDRSVRCWGVGDNGQLGYGNRDRIGDDETPGSVGPVDLGAGRTATAISAGSAQVCALLDDGNVRCWGFRGDGRLGYGNSETIGNDETPGSVGPVDLGPGRTATSITVGSGNACARLDDASVRCWGFGGDGTVGYGNTTTIGDDEVPSSDGPVDLGAGRTAGAVTLGSRHACARLDDASVRCWGYGGNGRLGYCNWLAIGDDEPPATSGPVDLGAGGAGCAPPGGDGTVTPPDAGSRGPDNNSRPAVGSAVPRRAEARRARSYRTCLRRGAAHARTERRQLRRGSPRRRLQARQQHLERHRKRAGRTCRDRFGHTPGRVTGLKARAVSKRKIVLSFNAPGSDGSRPPAARGYLVKQSRRPIRRARTFKRAPALCKGNCRFRTVTRVGRRITLTIIKLRPHTTYYYAVAARDNVSGRLGRRSKTVKVETR